MKKIIYIILFLPFISFAVELHPQEECEDLRYSMLTNVTAINSIVNNGLWGAVQDLAVINSLVNNSISSFKSHGDAIQYEGGEAVRQAYYNCADDYSLNYSSTLSSNSFYTAMGYYDSSTNRISSLRAVINSIDCTQCSVSSTNCCDFTEILQEIDRVAGEVNNIYWRVINIESLMTSYYTKFHQNLTLINSAIRSGFLGATNLLWSIDIKLDSLTNSVVFGFDSLTNLLTISNSLISENNLSLSQGFGNATNLLSAIYDVDSTGWGVATNYFDMMYMSEYADEWLWQTPEMLTQLRYPSYVNGHFNRFYGDKTYFNNDKWTYGVWIYGLAPTFYLMMQEMLGVSYAQNAWTQYQYDYMYPPITNSLIQIHADTTNFFSFFRGEIGVQGVLTDWTPQYGSYYDFLTNHYLAIMRGETLSANMSTKTNWFSRIETLLAALVFPDSPSTNVVDSSAYSEQQQAINSAISSVNSSAAQSFRDFETSANSVVSLYQMFAQNFDNVALPSRIVLFTLTNEDNSSEVIEFGLSDNPSLTAFVEGCRAVSTFCWASVGIFLLFKFMVWALRGIYLTILFVYKVISAVLH